MSVARSSGAEWLESQKWTPRDTQEAIQNGPSYSSSLKRIKFDHHPTSLASPSFSELETDTSTSSTRQICGLGLYALSVCIPLAQFIIGCIGLTGNFFGCSATTYGAITLGLSLGAFIIHSIISKTKEEKPYSAIAPLALFLIPSIVVSSLGCANYVSIPQMGAAAMGPYLVVFGGLCCYHGYCKR